MTRYERINAASLAVVIAVLLVLLGTLLPHPATASAQPAAAATVAAAAPAEEVTTDSESDPSGIDGMTVGELLRDAWTAQQAVVTGDRTMPEPLVATDEYVASYDGEAPAFPADYYRINSAEHENVVHIFRVVAAYKA